MHWLSGGCAAVSTLGGVGHIFRGIQCVIDSRPLLSECKEKKERIRRVGGGSISLSMCVCVCVCVCVYTGAGNGIYCKCTKVCVYVCVFSECSDQNFKHFIFIS